MENFCTSFSLQLQITCLNKADLSPSHFLLASKAGIQRLPSGALSGAQCLAIRRSSCTARHGCRGSAIRDTETLWCAAHGWNMAMDGYTIFRKDRWRRAGGVLLYIKEPLDKCSASVLETRPAESCWVKITARSNLGMLWSMSTTDCMLRGGRG